MRQPNFFLAIRHDGFWSIGRTDGAPGHFHNCLFPDGNFGRIIVAPYSFVTVYRYAVMEKEKWAIQDILDKQLNDSVYQKAILLWLDTNKVKLLR